MPDYVLGFVFDERRSAVLLIEKQRPNWQKGQLNGIGGKIELGELPLQAMIREMHEEAGLEIHDWRHYATLMFQGGESVSVFSSMCSSIDDLQRAAASNLTDEKLRLVHVDDVVNGRLHAALGNLQWLVPMAFDRGFNGHLLIDYGEQNGKKR